MKNFIYNRDKKYTKEDVKFLIGKTLVYKEYFLKNKEKYLKTSICKGISDKLNLICDINGTDKWTSIGLGSLEHYEDLKVLRAEIPEYFL